MVTLPSLWLAILLAAVLVFVASSVIHMAVRWHNCDYRPLANEEEVRAAILKGRPAPGQYVLPHCGDYSRLGEPEMLKKFQEGPVGLLYLRAPGPPALGRSLGGWFLFNAVLSFCIAYLLSRTLLPGTPRLQVFRVAATICFLIHAGGAVPAAIWMGKPWRVVLKEAADGLLYGLATGAAFSWLWPR
jgi:hypothetical protein